MRYLLLTMFLVGCSSYPKHNVGIVHDYVFENAKKLCANNGGVHYIVSNRILFEKGERETYPCTDTYKIRCQDQVLLDFDSEVKYCFISKSQLDETLQ